MDLKRKKILLVDDDADLRSLYADIFRSDGFDVAEAVDGIQGLDIATKDVPDLIFTGIIMPGMDGFEMIEALKKMVMTSNVPIVISSHMGREEDKRRAMELGVKDFIIKGYTSTSEVAKRVKALLSDTGYEYAIDFDENSNDALKLENDFKFPENFSCPKCTSKMQLRLKLLDPINRVFETRFFCPNDCEKKTE